MNILQTLLISVSMAVDTMCVGASDGIKESKMKVSKALFIAFVFGVFQGVMPTIGYFAGYIIKDYVSKYIPWIAFGILLFLGLKSIIEAAVDMVKERRNGSKCDVSSEGYKIGIGEILLQGVATSIDALTIGFIYTNESIGDALLTFLIIGIVTFGLSFLTTLLGKKIGCKLEKIAPFIAGIVFIGMAINFLVEALV